MNRSIPAGSGSSRAVRRLLTPASYRGRLKRLFSTARSITVPACGTFVLAVLLAGLPAHAQRICGAGGLALEPEMVFIPGGSFRMPEMVFIPGGSFRMGDIQGVGIANEKPVHTVTIKPFAVGKYEITRAQFEAFVDETGHDAGSIWRAPNFSQAGEHPVGGVDWEDARAYIAWLNGRTGKRYRLLTESEWEYVARAGTETRYHFGNDAASLRGNANCWESVCADGFDRTAPVGSFGANAFGVHDMHGNVWEWVEDCWHGNYNGAPTDGSAWLERDGGNCGARVLRGGSWLDNVAGNLRSAGRIWSARGLRSGSDGFRLAQDLRSLGAGYLNP